MSAKTVHYVIVEKSADAGTIWKSEPMDTGAFEGWAVKREAQNSVLGGMSSLSPKTVRWAETTDGDFIFGASQNNRYSQRPNGWNCSTKERPEQ